MKVKPCKDWKKVTTFESRCFKVNLSEVNFHSAGSFCGMFDEFSRRATGTEPLLWITGSLVWILLSSSSSSPAIISFRVHWTACWSSNIRRFKSRPESSSKNRRSFSATRELWKQLRKLFSLDPFRRLRITPVILWAAESLVWLRSGCRDRLWTSETKSPSRSIYR